MISKTGFGGPTEAAIGGMTKARQKLEQSAVDVARNGVRGAEAIRLSFSEEGRRLAAEGGPGEAQSASASPRPVPDLATALVNSDVAAHEHAANIKVLQTVDEMSDDLLDLKG